METIILAGGLGTRLAEETGTRPKPMVEIGGRPILWHIMSIYAAYGYKQFVIACGYRGEIIKEYFSSFYLRNSDLAIDLKAGRCETEQSALPDWTIRLIDTGAQTMTGGRLKRLKDRLARGTFMLTYGDGVADIDIGALVRFHERHGRLATITAVRPPSRFGGLELAEDQVMRFTEKPQVGEGWINGGFFVFEPGVMEYLHDDQTVLERGPLERLADAGELMAFRHEGFWQPMDTLREKAQLESLWASGAAPWKVWE